MRIAIILLMLSFTGRLLAQEGDLPDVEIQIVNPLKVTLPKAERNFSKVPALLLEPISPPIVYDYTLVPFSTPSFSPPVKPLRIKPPETTIASANYLSAGFGNFSSPYVKGYLSFFPSKSTTVGGLSIFHHSFGKGLVDVKNSSSGATAVTVNIKSSNNSVASEALAGFENRSANFYGYTKGDTIVDKKTIEQGYQTYFVSGKISNAKKSDFNFELRPSFSFIKDNYKAQESDLSVLFSSQYQMKASNAIVINTAYSFIARKDVPLEPKPRHLFKVTPQYQFSPIENLILKAGATVAFENDTIGKADLHFYPAIHANYKIGKNFGVFASLMGDMEKVSLHTLSSQNMWLNQRINIFHTNKSLDFSGGFNADLGSGFGFMGGFAFAKLTNYFLLQNDSLDQAKFNSIYDDMNRSNFFAAINFEKGNYSFRIKGDYFLYSTDKQQEAWHLPNYKVEAYLVIKAANKLLIMPSATVLGGMMALDYQPGMDKIVALPMALDLSTSIEYNFSDKIGVFLKLNNLLNSDYQLYNHYSVRGFQVLGGFTWKF